MGAFGTASAIGIILGPVISGLLYDGGHWNTVCWLIMGIMIAPLPFVLVYIGDRPMVGRFFTGSRGQKGRESPAAQVSA